MAENGRVSLRELVPLVREHLLPMIRDAVDVCVRSHADDEYNDNFTFGTQAWKNLWNRLQEYAAKEGTPFKPSGDLKDYSIRVQGVRLKPHSVNTDTRLPNSARAIKKRINLQLTLFPDADGIACLPETVVLAFEASPEEGLREVFLGVLQKNGFTTQYEWRDVAQVYERDGAGETVDTATPSSAERVAEEPEAAPTLDYDPGKRQEEESTSLAEKGE